MPLDLPTGPHAVLTEFGETPMDALENHLELRPQAPPEQIKPRDVVVAIKATAVGWVDLLMMSGQYQHMVQPPYTPGLEYAGEIVAFGEEVEGLEVGDRVIADGFLTGPRSKGDYKQYGGFAQWAKAPAEALLALPENLSFAQGANVLGNYETAYHCLVARGRLQEGESILIHGASGSTGLAALQMARLLGATVIATSRSQEKLARLEELGAHHTVCTTDEDGQPRSFRQDVKDLTEGRGVDVVYDPVGGPISVESMRCVRFGARFLIVGWAATPFVARGKGKRGAPNANQLPTNLMMMKGLDVLGCPTVISTHKDPSIRAQRLQQIMAWLQEGALTPQVARSYPLEELEEALRQKWNSATVGPIVVEP